MRWLLRFSFIDSIRDQPNAFLSSTHPTKYVEHIKNLINSNYMLPTFPIHVLTNVLHLSHSYLCALFKKEMGMSMQQYLLTVRLNNASRLLIESDLPINEIAYSCGFNDALYFSAIFKKKGGLSPKDYRKKYAKKSKT